MFGPDNRLVVFIATPLEAEQVDRINHIAPGKIEVLYDPDLLPPRRYSIDHTGRGDFVRTPEQEEQRKEYRGRAGVV